jgi:hypothetical protein
MKIDQPICFAFILILGLFSVIFSGSTSWLILYAIFDRILQVPNFVSTVVGASECNFSFSVKIMCSIFPCHIITSCTLRTNSEKFSLGNKV